MTIVMGLDSIGHRSPRVARHRTGEVSRGRVAPADRESVRRFLGRFGGRELEVALEATTGWRFVVEELRRSARSRISPSRRRPARAREQAARRRTTGRSAGICASCWAGRLPECWIAPDHMLISAHGSGCATRLWTSAASGSSGSRRCSITTGSRPRRPAQAREPRVGERVEVPAAGREQITVALGDDRRARPSAPRRLTASCAATPAASQGAGR